MNAPRDDHAQGIADESAESTLAPALFRCVSASSPPTAGSHAHRPEHPARYCPLRPPLAEMHMIEPPLFDMPRSTPSMFQTFWDLWPKKVARKAAEKAWRGAIKRASPQTIIAGAQAYKDSLGNLEPAFILHASTFLNGDRWEDYRHGPNPINFDEPRERKMWRVRLRGYKPNGFWPTTWGPRPGDLGFCGPKDLENEALK